MSKAEYKNTPAAEKECFVNFVTIDEITTSEDNPTICFSNENTHILLKLNQLIELPIDFNFTQFGRREDSLLQNIYYIES